MLNTNLRRVSLSLLFVAAAALAQTTPAFEVASIKKAEPLSAAAVMSGNLHIGMTVDAAMVNIRSMSLNELLRIAYKVKTYQISGPGWLGTDRFDITAKMPPGATRDEISQMMQGLLADRFQLTLHRSTTEQPVYVLVVMKSGLKLKESAPEDDAPSATPNAPAAPLAPTPADGGAQVRAIATSNANGVVSTSSINGNMKMVPIENGMRMELTKMNTTGITELLARFVDHPVLDMTDLKGRYDLNVDIGLEDMLNLARSQGVSVPVRGAESGHATDPGASSVFSAIQQYGLKLEPRRAPIDLLIIDHVEKTPTEN
jgi:uncharacterized protein (TIGR03435 family)